MRELEEVGVAKVLKVNKLLLAKGVIEHRRAVRFMSNGLLLFIFFEVRFENLR